MKADEVRIFKLALRDERDLFALNIGEVMVVRWSRSPELTPVLAGNYTFSSMEMTFNVTVGDDTVKFKRVK